MLLTMLCGLAMHQDSHKIAQKYEATTKPKLLFVGFYHFSNPGLDLVKADLDDHLSPKRQGEIEELVKKLARFKPTKIAVEARFESAATNDDFNRWLKGEYQIGADETEQVGFRLAKHLGHKQLFPIDTKLDMDFEPTMKLAASQFPEKMKDMQDMVADVQVLMSGFKNHSVTENLRTINDPVYEKLSNGFYLRMASVAKENDRPGAEMAAGWWKRNLLWLANLSTVAADPKGRVLVICGGGHASLLRSLLRDSIDYDLEPVAPYLK